MASKRIRHWTSLILVFTFVIGLTFPAVATSAKAAAGLTDISDHWAKDKIAQWVQKGLVSGYTDGTFKPDKSITRAEFMTLVNKVLGFSEKAAIEFSDVTPTDWFYEEIGKAVKAGYISGYQDGTVKPNREISRQEAAVALCKALNLEIQGDVTEFTDKDAIPNWSRPYIGTLAAKGYMGGYPDGSFKAERHITRAETVTMLDKVLETLQISYDVSGVYGPEEGIETISQDVAVNVPGVTLRNMIIEGNLYLNEGIGEGDATLDNVTVKGITTVRGGGKDSIHLVNFTCKEIEVIKVGGKVRIVASGNTKVGELKLESGAHIQGNGIASVTVLKSGEDVILDGAFENVIIEAKAKIEVLKGTIINNLKVNSKSDINLADGATVKDLTIEAPATITGKGTIEAAKINADGAKLETEPKKVELAKGVTVEIAGKEVKEDKTSSKSGGGGGGGGTDKPEIIKVQSVSLDKSSVTLAVYESVYYQNSVTLTATIEPDNATNKKVTWKSSNNGVATVTGKGLNATVNAVNKGQATITVTTDDGGKTAECNVTVVKSETSVIPVSAISVNPTTLTLTVGATGTITATVKPDNATNKKVNWSSSNTDVATVANGVVTAVASGTATITATTEDGGKTATCTVTVKAEEPVAVDKTALQAKVGEAAELAEEDYTAESWQALQEALVAAQAVLDNEEATQADVDAALEALNTAIAGLVEAEEPVEPSIPTLTVTGPSEIIGAAAENFTVTFAVDHDKDLEYLEIDHNLGKYGSLPEGVDELPEFKLYPNAGNPWAPVGMDESEASNRKSIAEGWGLSATYVASSKTWTLTFGGDALIQIRALTAQYTNNEFKIYSLVKDIDGNQSGSMYDGTYVSTVVTLVSPPVTNTTQGKGYGTIQAAITEANAGDAIVVAAGTFSEELTIDKSLTILGVNADNDARTDAFLDEGTVVTGGIRITGGDVTLKGLTIKGKGILASNITGLTVINNKITNISQAQAEAPAGSIIGLDVMTQATGPIVIRQNGFSDIGQENSTGTAIRMVKAADSITIADNIIENVTKNGINLYTNCLANENAKLTITGNEIINWDSDKDAAAIGGRAIRIEFDGAHSSATANITENKLIPPVYGSDQTPVDPQYVKLTMVNIVMDLTKNYWGSDSPDFKTILLVEGDKASECTYVPYFTDADMTILGPSVINSTQGKGYDTISAAVAEAVDEDTIVIAAGTFTEAITITDKSLTIQGTEGTILTAGIVATATANSNKSLTVSNITFNTRNLEVDGYDTVTISDNTFNDITTFTKVEGVIAADAIYVYGSNTGTVTIEGNTISGVRDDTNYPGDGIGITIHDYDNITIDDNTISDTYHNSINLYRGIAGEVKITNNIFSNWDSNQDKVGDTSIATGCEGGRALRLALDSTATLTVTGNTFIPNDNKEPVDDYYYVKITGYDESKVDTLIASLVNSNTWPDGVDYSKAILVNETPGQTSTTEPDEDESDALGAEPEVAVSIFNEAKQEAIDEEEIEEAEDAVEETEDPANEQEIEDDEEIVDEQVDTEEDMENGDNGLEDELDVAGEEDVA